MERYRINPAELLILAGIASGFVYSFYSLFQDGHGFQQKLLNPVSLEVAEREASRKLASESQSTEGFQTLTLDCSTFAKKATPEGGMEFSNLRKVRLKGTACGDPQLMTIRNSTNAYEATIFSSGGSRQYSTEYIPLVNGENRIEISWNRLKKFQDPTSVLLQVSHSSHK